MNFNIYNVLGICAPVVAFFLLFLIANVVGFVKDHWKKARLFIECFIDAYLADKDEAEENE